MPPPVAIRRPRNRNPQPLEYDHVLDRGRRDSLIRNRFQEHILPSPVESIDGKQKLRLAVAQAFGHCRRSVARKQWENNSADFDHSKKCRHRLRHHGHEERRYIPFLHAERAQRVSQTANMAIQFFVTENTWLAFFAFPTDRLTVCCWRPAPFVETIVHDVHFPAAAPERPGDTARRVENTLVGPVKFNPELSEHDGPKPFNVLRGSPL